MSTVSPVIPRDSNLDNETTRELSSPPEVPSKPVVPIGVMPGVLTKLSTRTGRLILKRERSATSCSVRESNVSSIVSFWS